MIETRGLIEHTRREISQLREELQSAWNAVGQSQKLLSRVERHSRSLPVSPASSSTTPPQAGACLRRSA